VQINDFIHIFAKNEAGNLVDHYCNATNGQNTFWVQMIECINDIQFKTNVKDVRDMLLIEFLRS